MKKCYLQLDEENNVGGFWAEFSAGHFPKRLQRIAAELEEASPGELVAVTKAEAADFFRVCAEIYPRTWAAGPAHAPHPVIDVDG